MLRNLVPSMSMMLAVVVLQIHGITGANGAVAAEAVREASVDGSRRTDAGAMNSGDSQRIREFSVADDQITNGWSNGQRQPPDGTNNSQHQTSPNNSSRTTINGGQTAQTSAGTTINGGQVSNDSLHPPVTGNPSPVQTGTVLFQSTGNSGFTENTRVTDRQYLRPWLVVGTTFMLLFSTLLGYEALRLQRWAMAGREDKADSPYSGYAFSWLVIGLSFFSIALSVGIWMDLIGQYVASEFQGHLFVRAAIEDPRVLARLIHSCCAIERRM